MATITKKCRFCGEKVADWKYIRTVESASGNVPSEWTVECLNCGATGPKKDTKVEAINAWND